ECLGLAREIESNYQIAASLAGLAAVGLDGEAVLHQAVASRAAMLFGTVAALLEAIKAEFYLVDRMEYERNVTFVRAALDEATFAAAWAAGQAMSLEQATAAALEERTNG